MTKTTLTLLVGLAVLPVTTARAGGFNLFWNDCSLGESSATNRSFACDTNEGTHFLVASFVPPSVIPVLAFEAAVDVGSDRCPLPLWWNFAPDACRRTAFTVDLDPPPGGLACQDPWQEQPEGGGYYYQPGYHGSNSARIVVSFWFPSAVSVSPETEYYAFKVVIANSQTVGENACTGCSEPMCFAFYDLTFWDADGNRTFLSAPVESSAARWQGGTLCCGVICDPPPSGCITPTAGRTWGQVKALYH